MTIGMKYMSARLSIIIGSVMVSLSYILTAYAEHIGILYFTVGFIQGEYCLKDHMSENAEKVTQFKGRPLDQAAILFILRPFSKWELL